MDEEYSSNGHEEEEGGAPKPPGGGPANPVATISDEGTVYGMLGKTIHDEVVLTVLPEVLRFSTELALETARRLDFEADSTKADIQRIVHDTVGSWIQSLQVARQMADEFLNDREPTV